MPRTSTTLALRRLLALALAGCGLGLTGCSELVSLFTGAVGGLPQAGGVGGLQGTPSAGGGLTQIGSTTAGALNGTLFGPVSNGLTTIPVNTLTPGRSGTPGFTGLTGGSGRAAVPGVQSVQGFPAAGVSSPNFRSPSTPRVTTNFRTPSSQRSTQVIQPRATVPALIHESSPAPTRVAAVEPEPQPAAEEARQPAAVQETPAADPLRLSELVGDPVEASPGTRVEEPLGPSSVQPEPEPAADPQPEPRAEESSPFETVPYDVGAGQPGIFLTNYGASDRGRSPDDGIIMSDWV